MDKAQKQLQDAYDTVVTMARIGKEVPLSESSDDQQLQEILLLISTALGSLNMIELAKAEYLKNISHSLDSCSDALDGVVDWLDEIHCRLKERK